MKDGQLQILYKACYARVLDARRKLIAAAGRYYELSLTVSLITFLSKLKHQTFEFP